MYLEVKPRAEALKEFSVLLHSNRERVFFYGVPIGELWLTRTMSGKERWR
jgi:hypothetical protein